MHIGFVGLGKMGGNMVERLLRNNHTITVFDLSPDNVHAAVSKGASGAENMQDLASKLKERKIIWMMIPAGKPVDDTIEKIIPLLNKNDILIDGGNSFWKDSVRRAEYLVEKGINYIDCGTSGGIWGLQNGYCLMYGGKKEACDYAEPIFKSLAQENGYLYCGPSGAGHFVKMIHNGIEYGVMQSLAEGFEILSKCQFQIDLAAVSKVWQHGSVVDSWLLKLASLALHDDPKLEKIIGYVDDSGEGRWTIQAAIDLNVPAHVITASLYNRFQSRQEDSFAMKLLAALRNQFGGHAVKSSEGAHE